MEAICPQTGRGPHQTKQRLSHLMRFALKAAQEESLFISALYTSSGIIYWTNKAADACSYSTLQSAKTAAALTNMELHIIPALD